MLAMALVGYQVEKTKVEDRIQQIRAVLGQRSPARSELPGQVVVPERRKFSAASKKRMAAAQKKRWAEIRKAAAKSAPVKSAKPAK
jgi:hypothetical protein